MSMLVVEIEYIEVCFHMAHVIGLWQWNDASWMMPTQDDLMFCNTVFSAKLLMIGWSKIGWRSRVKWRPCHAYNLMLSSSIVG